MTTAPKAARRPFAKTVLAIATLSTALSALPGAASAAGYQCYRPAVAAGWVKNRIPQGNWNPIHNTSKWSYDAVPGGDIFRHRNGNRTVGTRCKGIGYDHGTLKIDFVGFQDWCVRYDPGQAESIRNAACPSGHSLQADGRTCTRPATPGRWQTTRAPQGNWSPIHDTRKWSYDAVPGGDIYRHRNGNRTVGTRCKGPGYDHGTLKVDFQGYQDMCALWIAPVAARTVQGFCPSGHAFRQVPTTGGAGGGVGSVSGSTGIAIGVAQPARPVLVQPLRAQPALSMPMRALPKN